LAYNHFYDDWTNSEVILDALDNDYDDLPESINDLFLTLTTVSLGNITKHYEDALHCLLALHNHLRCPKKQHALFWSAHNRVSVPNFVSLISRLSLLQKSRSILVCLLRSLAGMATMQDRWTWNYAMLHYHTPTEPVIDPASARGRGGRSQTSGYTIEELHQSLREIEEQLNAIDLLDAEQAKDDAARPPPPVSGAGNSPGSSPGAVSTAIRKSYMSQFKADHAKEQFLGPSTRQIRESARRTMMMGSGGKGGGGYASRNMLVYGPGIPTVNNSSTNQMIADSYQTFLTEDPTETTHEPATAAAQSPITPSISPPKSVNPSNNFYSSPRSTNAPAYASVEAGKIDIKSVLANTQASLRRTMRLQVQNIVASANSTATIIASSPRSSVLIPSAPPSSMANAVTEGVEKVNTESKDSMNMLKPSEIMKRESMRRINTQGRREVHMTALLEEEEDEDEDDEDNEDGEEDDKEEDEEEEEDDDGEKEAEKKSEEAHNNILRASRMSKHVSAVAPTNDLRASVIAKLRETRKSLIGTTPAPTSTQPNTSHIPVTQPSSIESTSDTTANIDENPSASPPPPSNNRTTKTSLSIATEAAATASMIDRIEAEAEAEEAKHAAEDMDNFQEASPEVIQALLQLWLSSIPWNVSTL
jgi:hypothetical protein